MFGLGDNHKLSNDDPAMLDSINQLTAQDDSASDVHVATPAEGFSTNPVPSTPQPIQDIQPPSMGSDQVVTPSTSLPTVTDSSFQVPVTPSNDTGTQSAQSPVPTPTYPMPVVPPSMQQTMVPATNSDISKQQSSVVASSAPMMTSVPVPGSASTTIVPQSSTSTMQSSTSTDVSSDEDLAANQIAEEISKLPSIQGVSTPTEPSKSNVTESQPTTSVTPDETTTEKDAVTTKPKSTTSRIINHQQLAGMKQQALDHLEDLVDHLDQSPEDTFKTTMMMIQANDNHTLLEKALTAAKAISDDKVRAQALLDIVNEINYFANTQEQK